MVKSTNDFYWVMSDPPERIFNLEDNSPLGKSDLTQKLGIKRGDRVALCYENHEPVLYYPLKGNTLGAFFVSLSRGLHTPLSVTEENTHIVYRLLSYFYEGAFRKKMVAKYENGKLTPLEINCGYIYLTAPLVRSKGGVWTYPLEN